MTVNDPRITKVEALLTEANFDLACKTMREVVEDFWGSSEAWYLYAACLNESGAEDAAVDAALRSWILSGQQNSQAVHMAVTLLPKVKTVADRPPPSEESDPTAIAVLLIREQLCEELGL